MENFGTATKTGVKTSTKVIVGFLALGSIVAGMVVLQKRGTMSGKLFAPTIFPPTTTTPTNLPCNDSDGGIRTDVAGVTSLQDQNGVPVTSNADYCLSKEEVKEYYCGTKFSIASVNSLCPTATTKCLDGRCVPLTAPTTTPPTPSTTPKLTCNDGLDGGANIFVYGVTYLNDENGIHVATRPDYCIGSGSVRENYCDASGNLASSTVACPSSNICSGGRCVVPTTTPLALVCRESDGGININSQGYTNLQDPTNNNYNSVVTTTDYCLNSTTLVEFYCSGVSVISSVTSTCSSLSPCSMGSCVTSTPATTTASLNIKNIDVVSDSRIYGPSQDGVQLGKWSFGARASGLNGSVTIKKLTLQTVNPNGGALFANLGTFGTLSLYDGANLLATGSYIQGAVVFNGFVSPIPANGSKIYTLKGNINTSGTMTNNVPVAFVISSDQSSDIEAVDNLGVLLGRTNINFNLDSASGPLESRFARSMPDVFHDAYPVIVSASLGNTLSLDSRSKIFKFIISNQGTRDLRFSSVKVSVIKSGLGLGSINDFRLYEDNGSGALGTYIAQSNAVITSSTVPTTTIVFNASNDIQGLLESFVISPGASRALIVTASTVDMIQPGQFPVNISLRPYISGSIGWGGASWRTGDLDYYYTPIFGSEMGPFSASDSYVVDGGFLNFSL